MSCNDDMASESGTITIQHLMEMNCIESSNL